MSARESAADAVRWSRLRLARPEQADAGKALLYQFGVGLAFLGTVRPDGGPRLHPVCPLLTDDGLYAFVDPSLKREDLHRDPRYALHSYPSPHNEDVFYVAGVAVVEHNPDLLQLLRRQFLEERGWTDSPPPSWDAQEIFELLIDRCLHTTTTGHADFHPAHTVWRP
jgi:hypothetical protein